MGASSNVCVHFRPVALPLRRARLPCSNSVPTTRALEQQRLETSFFWKK